MRSLSPSNLPSPSSPRSLHLDISTKFHTHALYWIALHILLTTLTTSCRFRVFVSCLHDAFLFACRCSGCDRALARLCYRPAGICFGRPQIQSVKLVSLDGGKLTDFVVDGQCKESSDFESDFKTLSQYTKIVRTYSAVDKAIEPTCYVPSAILPAAAKYGIKVILGLW